MTSGLLIAALLASAPTPDAPAPEPSVPEADAPEAKPPKPTPEERLAFLDDKRIALNFGLRGYGRFLGPREGPAIDPAYGAAFELGLGVRLVRGLYLQTEVDVGAHALPVGTAGRVFIGARHELRMLPWLRPELSLGYSHAIEASFDAHVDGGCGWTKANPGWGFDFDAGAEASLASRSGIEAGLGLRMPFKRAPRLSLYVRGDASYYFDDLPGRLQGGGSLGLSLVF